MYKYAQMVGDRVYWILEHAANLEELYRTYFSKEIVFIDVTGRNDVQEGWVFDGVDFIEPTLLTEKELRCQYLKDLDSQYQPQFKDLATSLGIAILADNTRLIAELKADYVTLTAKYNSARELIING